MCRARGIMRPVAHFVMVTGCTPRRRAASRRDMFLFNHADSSMDPILRFSLMRRQEHLAIRGLKTAGRLSETRSMGKRTRLQYEPMEHLRSWRESLGMSRQEVANRIAALRPNVTPPLDQATLAKWEKGETAMRVEDLRLLAEVYGVTPDRLFFAPGDDRTPKLFARAFQVLMNAPAEDVEHWLRTGEALARPRDP